MVKITKDKCPSCGSTDISLNKTKGQLQCRYCRHEFELKKFKDKKVSTSELKGRIIGCGAKNIIPDTDEIITFKCSSCDAEVVIDTSEALHARCHWCRHTLTVKEQIPNGAVPDMVLPFKVSKKTAQEQIRKFVNKRSFFAHPRFKNEFCPDNVIGVYLPYMVVDINADIALRGQGERSLFKFLPFLFKPRLYNVARDFNLVIDGLTVEAKSIMRLKSGLNKKQKRQLSRQERKQLKNNNVINAIKPFDTKNAVKWNANYLKGFVSEKRDTDIEELTNLVNIQAKDIARHNANQTIKRYNRGVRWDQEVLNAKGKRWKTAYLPVWLYSYQSRNRQLHYVVVNGRSKKTSGNIPLDLTKLLIYTTIIQLIAILLAGEVIDRFQDNSILTGLLLMFLLLSGFLFFNIASLIYQNLSARHKHEENTPSKIINVTGRDLYIRKVKETGLFRMDRANNLRISNKVSNTNMIVNRLKWLFIIACIIAVILAFIFGANIPMY